MVGISRRALTQAVADRLEDPDLPSLKLSVVYRGEVDSKPPVIDDGSGRVQPYAVVWPSAGTPARDGRELADTYSNLDWLVQVTVAAGRQEDALAALDRVWDRLVGWAPELEGVACSPLEPQLGYDPGPMRRDDDKTPPRHYTPLLLALTATR